MDQNAEKIRQDQLEWVRLRLEALDKMEAKLLEMRVLASYATSRKLSETEIVQVQEWMDILQDEVNALERETSQGGRDLLAH